MHRLLTKETRLASRYFPKGSNEIRHPEGLGVVYVYTDGRTGKPCAKAFRGSAGKSEWHESFKTLPSRTARIATWFDSLSERKAMLAQWKAEAKARSNNPNRDSFSCAETAGFLRKALAGVFPGVAFSVRSSTYSGGASIDVSWTDGPLQKDVDVIADLFEGAGFDGMIDLKYYKEHWLLPDGTIYFAHTEGTEGSRGVYSAVTTEKPHPDARRVHLGADFVHCSRRESADLLRQAAKRVATECQLPELEVKESDGWASLEGIDKHIRVPFRYFPNDDVLAHDDHEGEWFEQLVYQVARNTSTYALPV